VTDPPDDAAMEGRELGEFRGAVERAEAFEGRERAAVGGNTVGRREPVEPLDGATARHERARRIATEEREPSPAIGMLDGLEQEALTVADELHVRRKRGLEAGEHLQPDRDDRLVARAIAALLGRGTDRTSHMAPSLRPPWLPLRPHATHTGPGVAPLPK